MANVTKDDESGIGVGNDTGILETDKSDEKTDAGTNSVFQGERNRIKYPGTYFRESEDNEENTLKEYCGQCKLP